MSKVSVDTCAYAEAVSTQGCRVERVNIAGFVVMSRGEYERIVSENREAAAAVTRAEQAVVAAAQRNAIIDELARKCKESPVCYASAKPHIAAIMGIVK